MLSARLPPTLTSGTTGHHHVVAALLEAGADPSLEDAEGFTPLHSAAMSGHAEVVRTLLKHPAGRATNKKHKKDGFHPIHRAAWGVSEAHTTTVGHFIEDDPWSVLLRTDSGYTPGELAALISQTEGNDQAKETTRIIHESMQRFKNERADNPHGFLVRSLRPILFVPAGNSHPAVPNSETRASPEERLFRAFREAPTQNGPRIKASFCRPIRTVREQRAVRTVSWRRASGSAHERGGRMATPGVG